MKRGFNDKIITSIDIGTTKISVLIGHQLADDTIDIIGFGKAVSEGLKKGVVVDIAKTVYAIKTAVKEAELVSGVHVDTAYIGVSGGHIRTVNSQGVVPIKRSVVRDTDVSQVLAAASAIPADRDYQILHVLPQYYTIDSREQVNDPIGMHGIRLEVHAHIILGAVSSVQNLVTCCQLAGITVKDVVLEQLASAHAVLSVDERELGVAVLDIGGGTSDLALYQHGAIRHTMVLPVAGNHFTNDIAVGLRITLQEAERIKKEWGLASFEGLNGSGRLIEVELMQGKDRHIVTQEDLVAIINPRVVEIFQLVQGHVRAQRLSHIMQTGIVLTGGGSLLNGIDQVAEKQFGCSARVGYPHVSYSLPTGLQNPMYATGYGLLLYALKQQKLSGQQGTLFITPRRLFDRMRSWMVDFF